MLIQRSVALALLVTGLVALASPAHADPIVYFYSGDLVHQNGSDPIGLKGAHFSIMTVIDDASVPGLGGPANQWAFYSQGKTFLTLSNATNPAINGTYTATSESLVVRAEGNYFGQLWLNSSFEVLGSPWYGGGAGGLAVANFPIGFFSSTFPALPTFNTFDVSSPNSVLYGPQPNPSVYTIDHFEASAQRISGFSPTLTTTFWNLLTQISGVGPRGPAGPAGPQGTAGATGTQGPVGPTGAFGPAGPIGPAGPLGPAGPAGLVWKGAWASGVNYAANDVVASGGASYVALQTNIGLQPPDSSWALVAAAGETGVQGPAGPQGPQGATGAQGLLGPIGVQGPAGPAGPEGPLGPTGLTWKGAWDNTLTYAANDAVSSDGSSYVSLQANVGSQPPSSNWSVLAAHGSTGPQGSAGSPGAQGAAGAQGPQGLAGAAGPPGSAGPQGLPGPQGIAGVSGRVRIVGPNTTGTLVSGARLTAAVTCPTGTKVLGGGGFADNANFVMVASIFQGDTAWWATFQNTSNKTQNVTINAEAICAIAQ